MPSGSATGATGRSRGESSSTAPANCTARSPRACGWWKCSSASRCARATTHNACWPRCPKAAARCCTSASRCSRSWRSASGRKACWAWPRCPGPRCNRCITGRMQLPPSRCTAGGRAGGRGEAGQRGGRAPQRRRRGRVGRHRGRRPHRSLQPQCDPRQPGHDLHHAGVRSRKRRRAGMVARTEVRDRCRPGRWRRAVHRGRLPRPDGHRAGQRGGGPFARSGPATTSGPSACRCSARPTA